MRESKTFSQTKSGGDHTTDALTIWSYTASMDISVSGGIIYRPSASPEKEWLHKGVKLILLLSGQVHCRLPMEDNMLFRTRATLTESI